MFPSHAVIVTSAGSSTRFSGSSGDDNPCKKKEFALIDGKTVLEMALSPFLETEGICAAVITYKQGTLDRTKDAVSSLMSSSSVPFFFAEGGQTRQKSVFNALKLLMGKPELDVRLVSIHDGARPFVTKETVQNCLWYANLFGGACPSLPVTDTVVRVDDEGFIEKTEDRNGLYTVQTPQTFRLADIYNAHVRAVRDALSFTDDTSVFTSWGGKVASVSGNKSNIKITYASDIKSELNKEGREV